MITSTPGLSRTTRVVPQPTKESKTAVAAIRKAAGLTGSVYPVTGSCQLRLGQRSGMSLEAVAKPLKDSPRWRIAKPLFGVTLEFVEISIGAGARADLREGRE